MKFGLFGSAKSAPVDSDIDSAAGYNDWIKFNQEAEKLGYYSTFTVEHHFTGLGQVSASMSLLTFLAAKTSTIRLGTAVMALPWHNPILLAEQASTLDLLSGGRLDFGVGKGYRYNEFHGFDIDMDEAHERYHDCLQIILKCWNEKKKWNHKSQYWTFNDVIVEPPCTQKPHPPIWMAAGHPDSIKTVAQQNCNLLLDQFSPVSTVIERVKIFNDELNSLGLKNKPQIALARAMYIAKDQKEKEEIIQKRLKARENVDKLSQRPDGNNKSSIMVHKGTDEAYNGALIGTKEEIIDRLHELKEGGINYILLVDNGGGIKGFDKFANEIMPSIH